MGGKSKGYRLNKQNKERMEYLRGELSKCHRSEWLVAASIFQEIRILSGNRDILHSFAQPRSCKFCGYFGHTKQHCAVRKQEEDNALAREIARDAEWRANYRPGDAIPEKDYESDS